MLEQLTFNENVFSATFSLCAKTCQHLTAFCFDSLFVLSGDVKRVHFIRTTFAEQNLSSLLQ